MPGALLIDASGVCAPPGASADPGLSADPGVGGADFGGVAILGFNTSALAVRGVAAAAVAASATLT